MAELNQIGVTLSPTKMISNVDNTQMMMAVGNELNRQYWQNRELFLTRVVDPLAKMQTTEYTKDAVNQIRNKYNEMFTDVEASGDWHKIGDKIYDVTQGILMDPIIKDIERNNMLYIDNIKAIDESDYDQRTKLALKRMASHQSSSLQITEDGKGTIGGYNPIAVGKPFDEDKFLMDIVSKLGQMKADGVTYDTLKTNPNELAKYGIDTLTGLNNEQIAAQLLVVTDSVKGIDYDRSYEVAKNLMRYSTDYINHLAFQFDCNYALKYLGDAGQKTDITLEDVKATIQNPIHLAVEQILKNTPYTLTDFIVKSNGKYSIKDSKNLTSEQREALQTINSTLGVNLTDALNNGSGFNDIIVNGLVDSYLNDQYNAFKGDSDIPFDVYGKEVLKQNYIEDHIDGVAKSVAGIYSYNETTRSFKLHNNPAYTEAMKSLRERFKHGYTGIPGLNSEQPSITAYKSVNMNTTSHIDRITAYNKIASDKAELTNTNKQLRSNIQSKYAKYNNIIGTDILKESNLDNINIASLEDNLATQVTKGTITNEEATQMLTDITMYLLNKHNISQYETALQNQVYDYNRLRDIYLADKDEYVATSFGALGNKIFKFDATNIMDKGLFTYEAYLKDHESRYGKAPNNKSLNPMNNPTVNPNIIVSSPVSNQSYVTPMSEQKYNKFLADIITQVQTRYNNKHPETPFEYTTTSHIISNGSPVVQNQVETMRSNAAKGQGGFVIVDSPTGKHSSLTGEKLQGLFKLDNYKKSTTYSNKGVTTTTTNELKKDAKGIDGSDFGIKGEIYDYNVDLLLDPSLMQNGQLSYVVYTYDKNNQPLGRLTVKGQATKDQIAQLLLDQYANLQYLGTAHNNDADQDLRNLIDATTNSLYTFGNTSNGSAPSDIGSLQAMIDKAGANGLIVPINIPMLSNPTAKGLTKTFKFIATPNGYLAMNIDNNAGYMDYGGYHGEILNAYTGTQPVYYNNITEALYDLTAWNIKACSDFVISNNNRR